ncbi:hypothetical protein DB30_01589 [Enhygromyxa salina]|uniref:Uncharacterized protein n=1 Tax=Enhygromyxa salina TaxID=215803 RepID=A0A0C2CM50_9BACT|nr:hypothetical protein [Enhygromyxa salina]KIG12321.1 hypothetical protein DB30_01589 [Enhygromyxa salina]
MRFNQHWAKFSISAVVAVTLACGPGEVSDLGSAPIHDLPAEAEAEGGVVGDPWHCGELGLKCVGGLGIGECIDGECQGRLIAECWSPEFAPTCDAFCGSFAESCAYLACDGATAWGWAGPALEADARCLGGDHDTVIPLTVTCDQPLSGLITTMMCCCI